MKTNIVLLFVGLALLMAGIYVSTLLTTPWVIIGTLMAIIGGGLTGVNAYSLALTKSNNY